MSKLDQFKARAASKGQSVTLYPFSANPSGDYIDTDSGYPDPEDADYPETVPEVTYDTAVTVTGFVQPPTAGERGTRYIKTKHGEEIPVDLVFFCPGDQAVTVRDKIVYGGTNYEVRQIQEFRERSTVVFKEVLLEKMTE